VLRENVRIPVGSEKIRLEGNRLYYLHPGEDAAALIQVSLAVTFAAGSNDPSSEHRVKRRSGIDGPTLLRRWLDSVAGPSGAANGNRSVQFYWTPQREGYRQIRGATGSVVEAVQYFKGNLYRRVSPNPWPFTPMNEKPLEGGRWTLPEAVLGKGAEFRLRLVDRNGGEGPPSESITLTETRP